MTVAATSRRATLACQSGCSHCRQLALRGRSSAGAPAAQLTPDAPRSGRAVRVRPTGNAQVRRGARLATLPAAPGVLVVPHAVGGKQVTRAEMAAAVEALRRLPAADLAMVAARGVAVHLYPVGGLEDGLLGATTIVQDETGGPWRPTVIRVAARAKLPGAQSLGEIVQHEFGHAVAVLRQQDRSEDAAIAYARRH